MVPQALLVAPPVSVASGTLVGIVSFRDNLRHRVGGVVVGVVGGTTDPTSVTDDQNNLYTMVTSANASGAIRSSLWYCQRIFGSPKRITVKWPSNGAAIVLSAVFTDQPLLVTTSTTNAANTGSLTVGPLAASKSGEELVFSVCASSGNLNGGPAGFVSVNQSVAGGFGYALPPKRVATWTNSVSVITTACIASFRAIPVATNPWAFDPIVKFSGGTPPAPLTASYAGTLTWTGTFVVTGVDAPFGTTLTWMATALPTGEDVAYSVLLTWTGTFVLAGVDDFVGHTLTWTGTFLAVGLDATWATTLTWTGVDAATGIDEQPLVTTLTWTGAFAITGIDATWATTLTWTGVDTATGIDEQPLADTLTWTGAEVATGVDAHWATTLTWTGTFAATGVDARFAHTLTWSWLIEANRAAESAVFSLLLWSDHFSFDQAPRVILNWFDSFDIPGVVRPPASASFADTLTWTEAAGSDLSWFDRLTWTSDLGNPVSSAFWSDTLFWHDANGGFDPNVNLLSTGRYRR
jgi:hypothetical protein